MSVYIWISVIILVAALLVAILLGRHFLAGRENGLIALTIVLLAVAGSVILYVMTSMQGTVIVSSQFSTEYQIKEETFKTTDENVANYEHAAYAFFAENGVKYQLHGTELLSEPASSPSFVGIYTCEAVDGYTWCYLRKGRVVRYTLTDTSKSGQAPVEYGN